MHICSTLCTTNCPLKIDSTEDTEQHEEETNDYPLEKLVDALFISEDDILHKDSNLNSNESRRKEYVHNEIVKDVSGTIEAVLGLVDSNEQSNSDSFISEANTLQNNHLLHEENHEVNQIMNQRLRNINGVITHKMTRRERMRQALKDSQREGNTRTEANNNLRILTDAGLSIRNEMSRYDPDDDKSYPFFPTGDVFQTKHMDNSICEFESFLSSIDDSTVDALRHEQNIQSLLQTLINMPFSVPATQFMIVKTNEKEVCAICLRNYERRSTALLLPCKHAFHQRCVGKWLKKDLSCPMCRTMLGYH